MKRQRQKVSTPIETKRCAIYTRKSMPVRQEQEFTSLDAQREACVGYIQRQPGWVLVPERYDDGGFTGANMERPAFQRLMEDLDAGKIDVVVVYKVDRLSRSLLDFPKVMERFKAANASFVSVTQNFSTADAMGRLTLNMLMSFAEFEREMIAERTKDKVAAARRKGKWTGGPVPLGYEVKDKRLVVDELEASVVREAFELYQQHGSMGQVARLLNERKLLPKAQRARNGCEVPRWTKDAVGRLLRNPVYAGLLQSGKELCEGEQQALVVRAAWERVQRMLEGHERAPGVRSLNPAYGEGGGGAAAGAGERAPGDVGGEHGRGGAHAGCAGGAAGGRGVGGPGTGGLLPGVERAHPGQPGAAATRPGGEGGGGRAEREGGGAPGELRRRHGGGRGPVRGRARGGRGISAPPRGEDAALRPPCAGGVAVAQEPEAGDLPRGSLVSAGAPPGSRGPDARPGPPPLRAPLTEGWCRIEPRWRSGWG
jgi:DNA invertase Pin-like site-specific DNA recombinase